MEDETFKSYCPVMWWIDRMGNIEFIDDQTKEIMNPAFYRHMLREADRTNFNASALM